MKKLFCLAAILFCAAFSSAAQAAEFINVATGSTGGTYYPVGSTMANIWRDNIPGLKASAQSTGGTVNNIRLLAAGEAEACITDGMYYDAYNGLNNFAGKKHPFLRGVVVLYSDLVYFVAAKDSGIKTLEDLRGRRVAVGAVGGSAPLIAGTVLKAAGIDMHKDIKPEYLGHAESTAAFADKHIDAAIAVGSPGIASVVEVTTIGTAHLLSFPPEIIEKVCATAPYFSPHAIKPDSYKGQSEPVATFSIPNILTVHEKLKPDLVYEMTRQLFAHKADLVAVAASMEAMDAEAAGQIKIPLHPGAEKYYKELGILK